MDIREIPISKLNPAAYNPRKDLGPDDPEFIQLEKSIKEFGNVDPIIWNEKTGNIVGGHQRFKVLSKDLKPKDKLAVSVVKLSERKEKMLNIALNKISGNWDSQRLRDLIDEINVDGFDMSTIGFEGIDMEMLFGTVEDYSDLDALTDELAGNEDTNISITVPKFHAEAVIEWLANGESKTQPGMGKGVLRRCGLL